MFDDWRFFFLLTLPTLIFMAAPQSWVELCILFFIFCLVFSILLIVVYFEQKNARKQRQKIAIS